MIHNSMKNRVVLTNLVEGYQRNIAHENVILHSDI